MPRGLWFRHNRIIIPTITAGSGEKAWVMTEDIQGNKVPKRIQLIGISVKPAASTIKALRIYSKMSRINDAGDADYSLIYEDTWTTSTLASVNHESVIPNKVYIDDDTDEESLGTIWGTLEIKANEANSAFTIDIDYIEH